MRSTTIAIGLLALCVAAQGAGAQQEARGRITGSVRGAETGNPPIVGATVQAVGTDAGAVTGAVTGEDGRYAIVVAPGTYRVRVIRIGYAPMTDSGVVVTAGGTATADFTLERQAMALDEMVVVGYGTQRRRDVTGAISSVNVEEIGTVKTSTSVGQLIQGRVAGAQVIQNNGAPGGGVSIRIRGNKSLTANSEPLYVIDGVPSYVGSGGQDPYTNPLAAINPQDIENIEVLKDASATSIYGARGANGVVLVTTKLGQRGQNTVTFQGTAGSQSPARYIPMLNGIQFAELANEASVNAGRPQPYTAAQLATLGAGTDWQHAVLRDAPIQSYTLSVGGGDDRTRYFLSGSYFDEQGIVRATGFERYAGRINLDRTVHERFRVGTSLSLSGVNTDEQITDNALNSGTVMSALWFNPNTPIRDAASGDYIQNSDITFPVQNPVALVEQLQNDGSTFAIVGNVFGELDLAEGLQLRSSIGTSSSFQRARYFAPRTTAIGLTRNGLARETSGTYYGIINENILSFNRALRTNDRFDATAGFTVQTNTGESLYGANEQFVNDITGVYDIGAGTSPTSDTDYNDSAILSYLARANYSLLDRYIFTVAGRYDGSSRFGANDKWAFFPSGAVAWRISEEPLLRNQTLFDDIKLRLGAGVTGNQEIGSYNSLARLSSRTYAFGGQTVTGYYPAGAAPNPDLRWETTRSTNAGIDVSLLHERISASLDVYNSTTDDLLLSVSLPTTSGYTSQLQNVGAMRNRGVEFALNTTNIQRPNLRWTSTFSIAGNRNRVLDLGDQTELVGPDKGISTQTGQTTVVIRVGEPIGSFLGYRTNGLYQEGDECPLTTKRARLDCVPGEYRYVDANGDGRINPNDRVILGDGNPDYYGGLQNNLVVGPLSLNVFLQGAHGGSVLNAPAINLRNINILSNQTADALNRWTPTNTNTDIPRANAARPREIYDVHVEDGSFLRLQSVSLGYDLPARLVRGVQAARLTLTGENLHVWSDYRGYDPEVNSFGGNAITRGIDLGAYPRPRRWTAGVNVTF